MAKYIRAKFALLALTLLAGWAGCARPPEGSPANDDAAIARQKICPVTGSELGSMGVPVKVHVKDRDVFLCCEGCRDRLLSDPDSFLAKLDHPSTEPPAASGADKPAGATNDDGE